MAGRKRTTGTRPGTRPVAQPIVITGEEAKVTTPDPDPKAPAAPKARKAKKDMPTMAEGTRQEVEIYGRAVDPFTGGLFRKNKETGDVEYFGPGEPDPDAKPTA